MVAVTPRREQQTARSVTMRELAVASRRLGCDSLPRFELKSPDFRQGELLPTRCSVNGDGAPPALSWGVLDPRPASFALICEDMDVTRPAPFVHWLVYGIAGDALSLDSNLNDFKQGLNDKSEIGFAPASPPPGEGAHRYCFQLFALDTELHLPEGRDYDRLISALAGHVTAWGELVGRYQRV